MVKEKKRLQTMIFGDPKRFAINFGVSRDDKVLGTVFFWIDGFEVGWSEEIVLPVNALCFLQRSLTFPDGARKQLCTSSRTKALDEVYRGLFTNDERSDAELRRDQDLFMPYLVSDYGTKSFDGWLVIRLNCKNEEYLAWRRLNKAGPSLEGWINLMIGEYRRVVEEALMWAGNEGLLD